MFGNLESEEKSEKKKEKESFLSAGFSLVNRKERVFLLSLYFLLLSLSRVDKRVGERASMGEEGA